MKLIISLLLFVCCTSLYAAEQSPFDAYAWYLPYGQVVRVNYRLSPQTWAAQQGKQPQIAVEIKAPDGRVLWQKLLPAERETRLDAAAMNERGDTCGVQFKLPLPDGINTATMQLQAVDGSVLQRMSNPIVVRKYAFEHNTIGEERVVIPPFEPIRAQANRATLWGREITFAPSGLPERIVALGKDLLAPGGIRLLLQSGAQSVEPKDMQPVMAMNTPDGYDATGSSTGVLGALHYRLDGRLEYDGAYFVHLELDSGEREVPVDRLTLQIPFTEGADTFSFQKNDRDINTAGGYARFAGIAPNQQGVIFDARKLPKFSAYGWSCDNYFVPAIYVGSGTRGLWYYADSDWDWYLNPANEHATLERVVGQLRLRVLLVNDHLMWKGKQSFDFVLMPQPVKPMPMGWRKLAWGFPEPQYVHDTCGWRYYGDGVNAFTLPTDDDYRQLGKVLAGDIPRPKNSYGQSTLKPRDDPRPHVLYGSSLMAGSGVANGEWDSYSSEWVGPAFARQPFDPGVKTKFGPVVRPATEPDVEGTSVSKKSYGGFEWKDDISFKPCGVQWTDSWVDFSLYYLHKLVSLAGVNGTWNDNQSCFSCDGYTPAGFERRLLDNPNRWRPADGSEPRAQNYGRSYHILQFRRYLKRLATMCNTAGVKPFWLVNQHPTWSFAQMAWHIEADYYCAKTERDLVEHLGVAGFRAHVRTQGGVIPRIQSYAELSDQPPREGHVEKYGVRLSDASTMELPGRTRTHMGLCLLHDVGMIDPEALVLEKLDREFGFFQEGVEYYPYWEQKITTVDSDRVYVSVFRNPTRKLALAVLFNEKKATLGLTVSLRIPESAKVRDMETGEPLLNLDAKAPGLQTLCYVPPRDFRLLVWGY